MDVEGRLRQVREELVQVEQAILSLERLARRRTDLARRGRPSAWMSNPDAKLYPSSRQRSGNGWTPPPAGAMALPRQRRQSVWAVAGKKMA